MARNFTGENAINGAFGELVFKGEIVANIQTIEARITAERRPVRRAGTIRTAYKRVGVTGEGTFTILRVSSEFMQTAIDLFDPLKPVLPANMTIKISDPDLGPSVGAEEEEITLENVKLWEIPFGFNVEDLISQTVQFTFEGAVLEQSITQPV